MTKLLILILPLSLGLTACSLLERSETSGYASNDDSEGGAREFYFDKRAKAYNSAKEELGLQTRKELGEEEVTAIQTRVELNRLEKNLQNSLDKKQYYSIKPYFNNDLERIYFLRLPNREAKERWANMKGVTTNETSFDHVTTKLIEKNDISRGMSRNAVRQSWGDPDFVEVAGEHIYGNERWRYNKLTSSDEGYKSEVRIIYFESGRVAGWETAAQSTN